MFSRAMPGPPPGDGISRATARLSRALAQRVPPNPGDEDVPDDLAATVPAICVAAGRRHGQMGALVAGALEVLSLMSLAIRLRKVAGRPKQAAPGMPSPRRLPSFGLSFRLAWKRLTGARTNAVWAISTLALGIGLSTAVFSVLDSIVWFMACALSERRSARRTRHVQRRAQVHVWRLLLARAPVGMASRGPPLRPRRRL